MIFEYFRRRRRNGDLFRKVANQIERFPDNYVQCDTRECIGGWALALSGCVYPDRRRYLWSDSASSEDWPVHLTAQSQLGLTHEEAGILFSSIWMPADGLSVPDALRMLAGGAHINRVTWAGIFR